MIRSRVTSLVDDRRPYIGEGGGVSRRPVARAVRAEVRREFRRSGTCTNGFQPIQIIGGGSVAVSGGLEVEVEGGIRVKGLDVAGAALLIRMLR